MAILTLLGQPESASLTVVIDESVLCKKAPSKNRCFNLLLLVPPCKKRFIKDGIALIEGTFALNFELASASPIAIDKDI